MFVGAIEWRDGSEKGKKREVGSLGTGRSRVLRALAGAAGR